LTVHVGEVHSEVVTATSAGTPSGTATDAELAERMAAALRRARWLQERLAAEGFDD